MIWPRSQPRRGQHEMPDVCLEGQRVFLRPPRLQDWSIWETARRKNRKFLKPFEPEWPDDCLSEEFFSRRLERQQRDWRTDSAYSFLIFVRQEEALIGGININNVCRGAAQYATLGYWLDEDAQGQGYMTEALKIAINYGFTILRLHRFNAACIRGNVRSASLLERLGFIEEGFAEKYVQIDGSWQDHRLFGLPAENWLPSESKSPPR